jgi:hypothetical protein
MHPSFRGQSSTPDFVQQGSVTDLQSGRGSFPIPAIGFQNAQNNFAFKVVYRLPGDFL